MERRRALLALPSDSQAALRKDRACLLCLLCPTPFFSIQGTHSTPSRRMEGGLEGLQISPRPPGQLRRGRTTGSPLGSQATRARPSAPCSATYPHLLTCLEWSTCMRQAFHMRYFKQRLRLETFILNQPDPQSNSTAPLGKFRKVIEHLCASLSSSFK